MKYSLPSLLFAFLFLGCEKAESVTLADLRAEATVWHLEAHTYSAGGPTETQQLISDRTLQFWEGKMWTNGELCSLNGPAGPTEMVDYDPVNFKFTVDNCLVGTTNSSISYSYHVDLNEGVLTVYYPLCVDGCSYIYRREAD